jgi:hypothetical protein
VRARGGGRCGPCACACACRYWCELTPGLLCLHANFLAVPVAMLPLHRLDISSDERQEKVRGTGLFGDKTVRARVFIDMQGSGGGGEGRAQPLSSAPPPPPPPSILSPRPALLLTHCSLLLTRGPDDH